MAEQQPRKKRKHYEHHMVWFSVFMLSILVTATMAVLGNALYAYAHRSDCVIELAGGGDTASAELMDVEEEQQTENTSTDESDTDTTAPETQTAEAERTAVITPSGSKMNTTGIVSQPTAEQNSSESADASEQATSGAPITYTAPTTASRARKAGFQVNDDDVVWSTDTPVELFQSSYQNASGEVTVHSGNTDHIVAPGTDGKYTFTLNNTGRQKINYKVWVEAEVTTPMADFPVKARMTGRNGWMAGDDDSWVATESLDGVSEESSLAAGKSSEYTIYWQWPFEQNPDEVDTQMGNLSIDQEISCKIRICTLATESSGSGGGSHGGEEDNNTPAGVIDAVGWVISDVFVPKTGDNANIWWWIGWIILAAAGITLCLYIRQRRKEQDEEDDTDKERDTKTDKK